MAEDKKGTWVLDDVRVVSVDFVPSWKEVDDDGNPTGRFKASIGQKFIDFDDLPEPLKKKVKKFVIGVLEDYA